MALHPRLPDRDRVLADLRAADLPDRPLGERLQELLLGEAGRRVVASLPAELIVRCPPSIAAAVQTSDLHHDLNDGPVTILLDSRKAF